VAVRACGSVSRAARGSVLTADTGGIEYRSRRLLADRPVVAVKLLLSGVGVKPRGRLIRNVHSINRGCEASGGSERTCRSPKTSRLRFPS